MSHKQNLHTHTTYVDGKDSPEELILRAMELGFDSIGFSEHSYLPYSSFPNQLTAEKMDHYRNEIHALKQKYAPALGVFCGLELDFYSNVDTTGLDYLIGSVHYLQCGDEIKTFDMGLKETQDYIHRYFDGDAMAFAKKYYETVARLPERGKIDVIGHFDLITKNNEQGNFLDTSDKEYLNFGFEAIHALKNKIPFFEVNTGAISRGYTSKPYPQFDFLTELRRCGFGAIITSDCHNKAFLDCHFEDAKALLIAAGFSSQYIFTDNGFKEIGL